MNREPIDVPVATARNQAEAELIQALLLEGGVPSMLRRAPGFDVPDFLAAGPREVLVPARVLGAAREILLQNDLLAPVRPRTADDPLRLALGLLVAVAVVALVIWLAVEVA